MEQVAACQARFGDGAHPKVGLREIAALSGVSRSTVALALKDSARVTPKLRAKIREVASRVGYTPNPYVSDVMSAIATGRWRARGRTLAVVVDAAMADADGVRLICGAIEATCAELGVGACVLHLEDPNATATLARVIAARGVSGGLWVGFDAPPRCAAGFPDVPWVAVGGSARLPNTPAVRHDRCHAIRAAGELVRALGCQRPFLLGFAADGVTGGHELLGGLADVSSLGRPDLARAPFLSRRVERWIAERAPDVMLGFGAATGELLRLSGCELPYVDLEHASAVRCVAAIIPDFDALGRMAAELVMTATYGTQCQRARASRTVLIPGRPCPPSCLPALLSSGRMKISA